MLKITIVAMGDKMPSWVVEGTNEYIRRFGDTIQLKMIELPLLRRSKNSDLARILEKEAAVLKENIPTHAYKIALDRTGKTFDSLGLAKIMLQLQQTSSHWCFIIGGPEGLPAEVLQHCDDTWSLSALTFPHSLVRIILLESLYRGWSIIHHHPYHR